MKKLLYIATLAVMLLSACKTPNVSYFQNVQDGDNLQSYQCPPVTMRPGDQITIFVKSIRPEITQMFNLTMGTTSTDQANNQRAYTVDSEGKIFLPIPVPVGHVTAVLPSGSGSPAARETPRVRGP